MICPKCEGTMTVIAFITEYAVVDRIIDHLELRFVAEKPPPAAPNNTGTHVHTSSVKCAALSIKSRAFCAERLFPQLSCGTRGADHRIHFINLSPDISL